MENVSPVFIPFIGNKNAYVNQLSCMAKSLTYPKYNPKSPTPNTSSNKIFLIPLQHKKKPFTLQHGTRRVPFKMTMRPLSPCNISTNIPLFFDLFHTSGSITSFLEIPSTLAHTFRPPPEPHERIMDENVRISTPFLPPPSSPTRTMFTNTQPP